MIYYNSLSLGHYFRFKSYGELSEVHISIDTKAGRNKGFAFVLFAFPIQAAQVLI
jgi:hypothetical protein